MLAHVENIVEEVVVWYVGCFEAVNNDGLVEVEGGEVHKNLCSGKFLHHFGSGLPGEPWSYFHLSDCFLSHLFGYFFCLNQDKVQHFLSRFISLQWNRTFPLLTTFQLLCLIKENNMLFRIALLPLWTNFPGKLTNNIQGNQYFQTDTLNWEQV